MKFNYSIDVRLVDRIVSDHLAHQYTKTISGVSASLTNTWYHHPANYLQIHLKRPGDNQNQHETIAMPTSHKVSHMSHT